MRKQTSIHFYLSASPSERLSDLAKKRRFPCPNSAANQPHSSRIHPFSPSAQNSAKKIRADAIVSRHFSTVLHHRENAAIPFSGLFSALFPTPFPYARVRLRFFVYFLNFSGFLA